MVKQKSNERKYRFCEEGEKKYNRENRVAGGNLN